MSPRNEPISKFLSGSVVTAPKDASIAEIRRLMRQHELRYIPIMEGTLPVGLIGAPEVDALDHLLGGDSVVAELVMRRGPYVVRSDAPLEAVTSKMVQGSYGAAIVTERSGSVVGVFSPSDVLRLLIRLIRGDEEPAADLERSRRRELLDERPPEVRIGDHAAGSLE
jgi:predicted transcriptional regulator